MGWIFLYYLLGLLEWLIIIRAVLSWFVAPHSQNPLVALQRRVTDPILRPFQQMVPVMGGLDLSALVAILVLQLLQQLVSRMMYAY